MQQSRVKLVVHNRMQNVCMETRATNGRKKWYDQTIFNKVIFPLVITAGALYLLLVLKHFGFFE